MKCCCGERHDAHLKMIRPLIDMRGETILVEATRGTWVVPRLYIAAHGIKGDELPELAKKYNWTEVGTCRGV